jgi:hypothetical protein
MKGTSRIKILSAAFSGLLLVPLATATPASAVELVTPYPAVAAEPGQTSTFDLQVTSDESELVQLRVTDAPEGWDTVLRGDGREVSAVYASANEAREVQLDVTVPAPDERQPSPWLPPDRRAGPSRPARRQSSRPRP